MEYFIALEPHGKYAPSLTAKFGESSVVCSSCHVFLGKKKPTKGTPSSSKTLVRNGHRALKDLSSSKCYVNFHAIHYLHY